MSAAVSADHTMFGDGLEKHNNNNNSNGDRESRNNNGTHAFETISESTTTSASSSSIFKSSMTTTASNVSRSSSYHLQHLKSAYGASGEFSNILYGGSVALRDYTRLSLADVIRCHPMELREKFYTHPQF